MVLNAEFRNLSYKELAICGLFGALFFVTTFVLGSAIILATGIPFTGALLNMLPGSFIAVIGAKIVNKFGSVSLMMAIASVIAIPTVTFGPPGIHKVVMMLVLGLIIDLILLFSKRSNIGYLAGLAVGGFLSPILMYLTLILVGLPGAERLEPMLPYLSLIYAVEAVIGAYIGLVTYDRKISRLGLIKVFREG